MLAKRKFDLAFAEAHVRKIPILRNLHNEKLMNCLRFAFTSRIAAGKKIFRQDDIGEEAIFVSNGLVSLSKLIPAKRRVTVELLGQGEPVGVFAVLNGQPFPLEAAAFMETILLCIPKSHFQALLQEEPSVAFSLNRIVAARFRRAQDKIAQLVSAGAKQRVAASLKMLLERPEACIDENVVLVSRKQLAEMTGITTETCIRLTRELEFEKVVSFPQRKQIKVDIELLKPLAIES